MKKIFMFIMVFMAVALFAKPRLLDRGTMEVLFPELEESGIELISCALCSTEKEVISITHIPDNSLDSYFRYSFSTVRFEPYAEEGTYFVIFCSQGVSDYIIIYRYIPDTGITECYLIVK